MTTSPFHTGQRLTIMNINESTEKGWTGIQVEVTNPRSWVSSHMTEVKIVQGERPDRPAGYPVKDWHDTPFHWTTADLRPTLSTERDDMEQYDQDWNLKITGPDFVTRGTPDWMVEAVGESLHKQINEIMDEARSKISEVVGENYNVSLDHI